MIAWNYDSAEKGTYYWSSHLRSLQCPHKIWTFSNQTAFVTVAASQGSHGPAIWNLPNKSLPTSKIGGVGAELELLNVQSKKFIKSGATHLMTLLFSIGNSGPKLVKSWGPSVYLLSDNLRQTHFFRPSQELLNLVTSILGLHLLKINPFTRKKLLLEDLVRTLWISYSLQLSLVLT